MPKIRKVHVTEAQMKEKEQFEERVIQTLKAMVPEIERIINEEDILQAKYFILRDKDDSALSYKFGLDIDIGSVMIDLKKLAINSANQKERDIQELQDLVKRIETL